MLNGRVYGSKNRHRGDVNHFANIRDEEPEFVEWGYGGMGSVKGGRHAGVIGEGSDSNKGRTQWERLHGRAGVGETEDDDDGTGMGWVRKRKEAREREKREKEEREKAEAEKAEAEEVVQSSTSPTEPTEESSEARALAEPSAAAAAPATDSSIDAPVGNQPSNPVQPTVAPLASEAATSIRSSSSTLHLEHNLEAVTLPAHLSRRHMHKRSTSRGSLAEIQHTLSTLTASPVPIAVNSSPLRQVTSAKQEESSTSDSESDSESEDDGEDEEDEEVERHRQTALSAGVEKISRHHDNN